MAAKDPNRQQLARVARALGSLRDQVVFVGGSTVGLFVTDPVAPPVRPTKDVDVVVEVASYADYQLTIVPNLKVNGFQECTDPGAPICAWKVGGIRVDVMPTEASVRGTARAGRGRHPGHQRDLLSHDEIRGLREPWRRRLLRQPRSGGHHYRRGRPTRNRRGARQRSGHGRCIPQRARRRAPLRRGVP